MIFVKFLVDELPYYDSYDGELYSTGFMQTGIHEFLIPYYPYCGMKLSLDNSNKDSYQFAIFTLAIMEEPKIILKEQFTMRTFKTYNVIVTSISELCRWLQRDDVSIVELVPTKGIDNEDVIKINFVRKKGEES